MTAAAAPAAPTQARVPATAHAAPGPSPVVRREPAVDPLAGPAGGRCACGGGCPACAGAQPSLLVGALDDPAEREADRVADAVSGGGEAAVGLPGPRLLRRCGAIPSDACPCHGDSELAVARSPAHGIANDHALAGGGPAPASVASVVGAGGGRPLEPGLRDTLEARLGTDLGPVRVHTDARAAASAAAIGARAYTLGSDVVFGAGQYAPHTGSGLRTLAHELAHVVQQRAAGPAVRGPPASPARGVVRRQGDHPFNVHAGPPSNVPSEKWREDVERAYRRLGFTDAAQAVHDCRVFAACEKILTVQEAWRAYQTGRISAGLGAPPESGPGRGSATSVNVSGLPVPVAVTPAAGLTLAASAPAAGGATTTAAAPSALARASAAWSTEAAVYSQTGVSTGAAAGTGTAAGVASVAIPIAVGTMLVVSTISLVRWTRFQVRLREAGYVVLPDALGACIGACHASPREEPRPFPRITPEPRPLDPDALRDYLRRVYPQPAPTPTPKPSPTPYPRPQPQPRDRRRRRVCRFDPCELPLPISWPAQLPYPPTTRRLTRTTAADREWEGIDRGSAQQRFSERIRQARDRLVPPPNPCHPEDAEPNAPYDAHHAHPLYLGGEDAEWNLCSLRADKHQRGHPRLDNQTEWLETYLECGICSGYLSQHPAGQDYEIVASK